MCSVNHFNKKTFQIVIFIVSTFIYIYPLSFSVFLKWLDIWDFPEQPLHTWKSTVNSLVKFCSTPVKQSQGAAFSRVSSLESFCNTKWDRTLIHFKEWFHVNMAALKVCFEFGCIAVLQYCHSMPLLLECCCWRTLNSSLWVSLTIFFLVTESYPENYNCSRMTAASELWPLPFVFRV